MFSSNPRLRPDRRSTLLLARYLVIGLTVFCIDVGSFQLMLRNGVNVSLAATIAFGIALLAHFSLNRWANFRNFERTAFQQGRTYAVVAFFCWLVTLLTIQVCMMLGMTPLVGKLIAVAVNIPLGFLGHRYLTFGTGIKGALRGSPEPPQ